MSRMAALDRSYSFTLRPRNQRRTQDFADCSLAGTHFAIDAFISAIFQHIRARQLTPSFPQKAGAPLTDRERFERSIPSNWDFADCFKYLGIRGISRAVIVSARLAQAETSYRRLLAQHAKTALEATDAERQFAALVRNEPIVELNTQSQRLFFASRSISDAGAIYRVFRTELAAVIGEEPIGFCEVGKIVNGICVISNAEVSRSHQRKGIATAVYDLITSDMSKVGALLWPVSPTKMSDAEFKVWWRRSPALVFYYPHRYRLGLKPRAEFEELFEQTLNRGIWERCLSYCSMIWSRALRAAGLAR